VVRRSPGPGPTLSGQLNRRLAEYALDRTTAETDSALAGEPASAALADSFSSRFSLFDDAGVGTADALAAEFEGSALDDRIATATVDAYRHYRDLHADYVDEWVCTRGEMFDAVATTEKSFSSLSRNWTSSSYRGITSSVLSNAALLNVSLTNFR